MAQLLAYEPQLDLTRISMMELWFEYTRRPGSAVVAQSARVEEMKWELGACATSTQPAAATQVLDGCNGFSGFTQSVSDGTPSVVTESLHAVDNPAQDVERQVTLHRTNGAGTIERGIWSGVCRSQFAGLSLIHI